MIVVWGRASCGPCMAVKSALRAKGIPFTERNLDDATPADWERWRARAKAGDLLSAPVVEHAGGVFAGMIPHKVRALIDARV